MQRNMTGVHALLIAAILLLGSAMAHAQYNVGVLFSTAATAAHPGDVINYDVAFTNHETNDITLDGVTLNLTSPPALYQAYYITPVLNPASFTLAAATSATTPATTTEPGLFSLYLDPGLSSDPSLLTTYTGTFSFTNDTGGEVNAPFSLTVTSFPIPESPFYQMSVLLVLGAGGMWRVHHRRDGSGTKC